MLNCCSINISLLLMMKTIVLNIFLETLISFFQDSLINKKYQKNSIYVHYNSFVTVYMFLLSLLINSMYPFLISLIITRNLNGSVSQISQKASFKKLHKAALTLTLTIRNVSWAPNQHIRKIYEGSCGTEDWTNNYSNRISVIMFTSITRLYYNYFWPVNREGLPLSALFVLQIVVVSRRTGWPGTALTVGRAREWASCQTCHEGTEELYSEWANTQECSWLQSPRLPLSQSPESLNSYQCPFNHTKSPRALLCVCQREGAVPSTKIRSVHL